MVGNSLTPTHVEGGGSWRRKPSFPKQHYVVYDKLINSLVKNTSDKRKQQLQDKSRITVDANRNKPFRVSKSYAHHELNTCSLMKEAEVRTQH